MQPIRMCLAAVEHVLDENRLAQFGIDERWIDWLRQAGSGEQR